MRPWVSANPRPPQGGFKTAKTEEEKAEEKRQKAMLKPKKLTKAERLAKKRARHARGRLLPHLPAPLPRCAA